MATTVAFTFPEFDDLPPVQGQPQGCLWGYFDRDGYKDELGTLNLITADVVVSAAAEIRSGRHVQLDLPLDELEHVGFGRRKLGHEVMEMSSKGFIGLDDEIHINTQSSSQWDSLRHFTIQSHRTFYNGLTLNEALESSRNGIHNICARGGIAGRGVLVDWLKWWENHNPPQDVPAADSNHAISASEIEQVLKYQNTQCRPGDILIVRTGYIRWYRSVKGEDRDNAAKHGRTIGIANNMDTVRWLYNHHLAAVAADNPAFESTPIPDDCCLHEWLLCQWGTNIGELWDLEELSEVCAEAERWSFFLTSAPLHVRGGVASTPNVIAVL